MTEIKLEKRYPNSRVEDITDAFMRGYQQGKHEVLRKFSGMILDIMQSTIVEDEQTDIHGLTDCDFCKDRNCEDCEGGKDRAKWLQFVTS